jgi:hypothetical protein
VSGGVRDVRVQVATEGLVRLALALVFEAKREKVVVVLETLTRTFRLELSGLKGGRVSARWCMR